MAGKGADGQMHTLWQAEERVQERAAQPENDGTGNGRVFLGPEGQRVFIVYGETAPSRRSIGTFKKATEPSGSKAERRCRSEIEERLRIPRQDD